MKKILAALPLAALLAAPAVPAAAAPTAQLDPDIVLVLEAPGDTVSGIGLVQGFALSKKGAIDYVTWAVDGDDNGFIPYGGSRGDVAAVYPGYADSMDPGFATAWNYNHFAPGEHEIVVRAYDDQGGYNEVKKKFRTTRFGDGDDKYLTAAEIELDRIPIAGLQLYPSDAKGDRFDVQLTWSKASQQFVIESIEEVCSDCDKLVYDAPVLDPVASRSPGRVDLSWSGGSAVLGYQIERRAAYSIGEPGPWIPVGIVSGVDPYFVDVPPPPSGTLIAAADEWQYRVRGLGPSDKSAYSNTQGISMVGF